MDLLISQKIQSTRDCMEAKTKILLLEIYKKMYEAMKHSAEKKRIEKLIKELENESKSD